MPIGRSYFFYSREFRQLCIYAALLLTFAVSLVVTRLVASLRRAQDSDQKPRHSRRKRNGKSRIKER